jgi:hypothetical protein
VLGPAGRVFYVSPQAVYVWTTGRARGDEPDSSSSTLYALPLDGSAPGALGVSGSPVDQFSFLESNDGHLNVLVRSYGRGDAMWNAERADGSVALLRVPVSMIGDGSLSAISHQYRRLPKPDGYAFQNRFVGDFLLYGTGNGWGWPNGGAESRLYAVLWKGGEVSQMLLPHGVDRIEALGSHAAVIGTVGRNLHFSTVRLGRQASLAGRFTREEASQGELRSHGFFYKPEDGNTGLLGLPIRRAGQPGYRHLFPDSAAIVFLRNDGLQLQPVGEVDAQPANARSDACRASCVDWYGNARPLFIKGRVFALLGYELVEGSFERGRLKESRRVNYAPGS